MPKTNDVAGLLDLEEDMPQAQGSVYFDPYSMVDYGRGAPRGPKSADKKDTTEADTKKAKPVKAASYKAKLLLTDEKSPIGQFKGQGTRVSTRIYFDERLNWSSCIRIEIKAWTWKQSKIKAYKAEVFQIHKWTIRLNVACIVSAEPEVHIYEKAFMGKKDDAKDYLEEAYINYCVRLRDQTGIDLRGAGQLGYLNFNIRPALAHTEGILHHRILPRNFQPVQEQLFRIFSGPTDKVIGLSALFAVSQVKSFHIALAGVRDAFAVEQVHPPYTRWFGGIADAKSRVQKGQVTPREHRPPVHLPFSYTYADSSECWTFEGMSIIYQQENELEDTINAQLRNCQLRILKVSPGGDRVYLGLLQLPTSFEHRFSSGDSFLVELEFEKKKEHWRASILPSPFPYASSIDYTIALYRHRKKADNEYSALVLESVYDLSNAGSVSPADLEAFCFNGKFNKVKVVPIISDKTYKFRLAAVKTLNPAHREDKDHVHNPQWETLILGQDLRTKTEHNLFEDIDIHAKLREWSVELDDSQLEALENFTRMPNRLGIVNGPWGTGKTKVDMVITMLLMSAGRKVKVLSPTNKAADSFVVKLKTEIARLKDEGITITDKHVVRFHSPTTEQAVDSRKHRTRDPAGDYWDSSMETTLLASQYDSIAARIMEEARARPYGVSDVRYKLHEASFGTLLLRVVGLLDRPQPNLIETQRDTVPTATPTGDTAPQGNGEIVPDIAGLNLEEPPDDGGTDEGDDASEPDDNNADFDGAVDGEDYQHPVGATYKGANTKAAQAHQQLIQRLTQEKLDEARGLTYREKLCASFREMFLEAEQGNLDSREKLATFKALERRLTEDLLSNDVAVLATTLVNSGHSIVKNYFKGDHVIVQEASKAENGDLFIALANCETSISLSGDDAQLAPPKQDVKRNPFAEQTNVSLYHRWVSLGYSMSELKEQHRTIPVISNLISDIWYRNTVVSKVDPTLRPNARMATAAHDAVFKVTSPIIWIDTDGTSNKMGFSQSSQNEKELKVALKLCQAYIDQGITPEDIVILAGYLAQIGLTRRELARTPGLKGVDACTIDAYQGEEKPVVILCIVGCEKLGFMSEGPRLLSGISRAGDALAIITNESGIQTGEHARKRFQWEKVRGLIGNPARTTCKGPLADLKVVMYDHDLELDDGAQGGETLAPADETNPEDTGEDGNGGGSGPAWIDEEEGMNDPLPPELVDAQVEGGWGTGEPQTWQ